MTAQAAPERTLTLCADDFGLTPGISAGIAQLAQLNRLSWVSCITNSPHWHASAALLEKRSPSLKLGLHINLTEGRPLSPGLARIWPRLPALPVLIVRAHLGLLPRAELHTEIQAQLAALRAALGCAPQFVDGHQHIHHLPRLRGMVLDLAAQVDPPAAVRNTGRVLGPGFGLKRWMIEGTGAHALQRALLRRKLPHNTSLLGVYDFRNPDYRGLMQGWLARLPAHGGLLFCHPARAQDGPDDGMSIARPPEDAQHRSPQGEGTPVSAARLREFAYLSSDAFLQDLAHAKVRLGPLGGAGSAAPDQAWAISGRSTSG